MQHPEQTPRKRVFDFIVSLIVGILISGVLLVGNFWLNAMLLIVFGESGNSFIKLFVLVPLAITALVFWIVWNIKKGYARKGRPQIGDGLFIGIFVPFLLFGACSAIMFGGA